MQLEVQWFISALIQNQLMTLERGIQINQALGGEPGLEAFAQAIYGEFCGTLSEEDAQAWAEQLQTVAEYAQQQAEEGVVPPEFSDPNVLAAAQQAAASMPAQPPGIQAAYTTPTEIPSLRGVAQMTDEQVAQTMQNLLLALRVYGASDLHVSAGAPLFIRRRLKVERIDPEWVISPEDSERLNMSMLTEEQRKTFRENLDMNIGLQLGTSRFRTSLMMQKTGVSGTYRLVPDQIRPLLDLGFLPEDAKTIERLLDYHNGLIIVTGPLGSGKTTTLASMIEVANQKRQDHIITVEDPIEIVQHSKGCQITQREVGRHTNSYHAALKGALREDPDIIVIGEMHDLETIENAITASETGHLVIGTLHTCDAANTLNRLLDVFPPNQQPQIRAMTAGSLRGIICQKLVTAADGTLTSVYEILLNTLAVSNIISEGKIYQLKATMQIGSKAGMCTIDQNIQAKYEQGILTYEDAMKLLTDSSVIAQVNRTHAIQEAKKLQEAKLQAKKK